MISDNSGALLARTAADEDYWVKNSKRYYNNGGRSNNYRVLMNYAGDDVVPNSVY
jgi:hypothetical protein